MYMCYSLRIDKSAICAQTYFSKFTSVIAIVKKTQVINNIVIRDGRQTVRALNRQPYSVKWCVSVSHQRTLTLALEDSLL